ncbi:uncharacterized protein LOC125618320 [Marmota marmota marmota]|uniref:uncharacterized protein LOC125618320 n=1 Tax=Marmota marmota marmota TaxID=9994 RepID=UPI00209262E7|nr:uncharacterized protein LOC125618320 [Marmota marmota marmota]
MRATAPQAQTGSRHTAAADPGSEVCSLGPDGHEARPRGSLHDQPNGKTPGTCRWPHSTTLEVSLTQGGRTPESEEPRAAPPGRRHRHGHPIQAPESPLQQLRSVPTHKPSASSARVSSAPPGLCEKSLDRAEPASCLRNAASGLPRDLTQGCFTTDPHPSPFRDRVLLSCSGPHQIAEAVLGLAILLSQPPELLRLQAWDAAPNTDHFNEGKSVPSSSPLSLLWCWHENTVPGILFCRQPQEVAAEGSAGPGEWEKGLQSPTCSPALPAPLPEAAPDGGLGPPTGGHCSGGVWAPPREDSARAWLLAGLTLHADPRGARPRWAPWTTGLLHLSVSSCGSLGSCTVGIESTPTK